MTSLVRKRVMSWCWAEEWLKIRHDSGCRQDAAAVRSVRHTHSGQEMPGCAHLVSNLWWTNLQDRRYRVSSCLMRICETHSGQEVLSFAHLMLYLWGTFRTGGAKFFLIDDLWGTFRTGGSKWFLPDEVLWSTFRTGGAELFLSDEDLWGTFRTGGADLCPLDVISMRDIQGRRHGVFCLIYEKPT